MPCVVACHGMGASKDSDKYLLLGRELPAAGLALARFDFRGSGESGGRHEDATIETRMADLEAVLDHLGKRPELDGRFGLLGSSLGGFVALWVAAAARGRRAAAGRDLERARVAARPARRRSGRRPGAPSSPRCARGDRAERARRASPACS